MAPILGIYASQISGHLFAPSGAYDSIATVTVGSGGSSSITFNSIPSTYQHLQIRVSATNGTGADYVLRYNGDSGSNYRGHVLYGDGASAFSSQTFGGVYTGNDIAFGDRGASYPVVAVTDILDYANSNKYTTLRSLYGTDANGSGQIALASGLWMNTAAVTSISVTAVTSTFNEYSSFALYGIKGN
jgi:hypothetical protein